MKYLITVVCAVVGLFLENNQAVAQSPDSRICRCFSEAVTSNFMLGSKAIYGTVGVMISRDLELPPSPTQPVQFIIPTLPVRSGCQGHFSLYITNSRNEVLYNQTSTSNEFRYTFRNVNETYDVMLMATGRSVTGRDGNCSRSIRFTVKPRVLTPRS